MILKNLGNGDVTCPPLGQQIPFISGLSNLIFGGKKKAAFYSPVHIAWNMNVLMALQGHDSSDTNSVLTFCWDDFGKPGT